MGNFKQEAESYEKPGYNNISELNKIDFSVAILEETLKDGDGKEYTTKYIEENGKKYRVPVSIFGSLKEILAENPKLKFFKVNRTGTTKEDTRYTVIQLT